MWSEKRKRDYKTLPIKDRIAGKTISTPSGCIEWQGGTNNKGYGLIGVGSRTDGTRTLALVHREAYKSAYGEVPDGMFVLHKCDNPKCCNPEHLFIGDQSENIRDCICKGRFFSIGKKRRTLTEEAVKQIKRRVDAPTKLLSEEFGVSRGVINHIKRGSAWAGVQP